MILQTEEAHEGTDGLKTFPMENKEEKYESQRVTT
jgi:hypothetical protein